MDETQPYEAILETYKTQELLAEKHEQLNKYLSEYQNAVSRRENIKECIDNESLKLNKNELKLIENTQYILSVSEENDMAWKGLKKKHNKLYESRTKIYSILKNKSDILQDVSNDLRQLHTEHQSENILTKIENYRSKTKNVSEIVGERCVQYQNLNFVVRTDDYQIPSNERGQFPRHGFTKSLTQINEEIKKAKKNIHTIDLKTKELEQQL